MSKNIQPVKTNITVKLTSYGTTCEIAQFGRNNYDAIMFLRTLQFQQFMVYGAVLPNYRYFIEYREKGVTKTFAWEAGDLQNYGRELMEHLNANTELFRPASIRSEAGHKNVKVVD